MAKLPTIICWGQSNMNGLASLTGVPQDTFSRWTGQSLIVSSFPVDIQCPGIYIWTPRMPYGITTNSPATYGDSTHVTVTPDPGITGDRWVYVRTATTGQGQLRRVTANAAGVLTITPAWTPTPTGTSTVDVWMDSETVSSATSTSITKTGTTANLSAGALIGKWMVITSGTGVSQSRQISDNTTTVISFVKPLTTIPLANDGFRILTGTNTVDSDTVYQSLGANAGSFRSLRFYYDLATSYSDPYEYPNFWTTPLASPALHAGFLTFGAVNELSWQFQHSTSTDLFIIHVSIGSTYMSRFLGDLGYTSFAWAKSTQHNDWHPASTDYLTGSPTYDLFDVLMTVTCGAAKAWIAANRPGDTLDVQGFFGMEGESEALDSYRAALAGVNMAAVRDAARQKAVDLGITSLPTRKIPWIFGLVRTTSNHWPFASTVNPLLKKLADDDMYTGYVSTDSYPVNIDEAHYNATGQIQFGVDLFNKWLEIKKRETSATVPDFDRLTLSSLRDKVRRRYERCTSSNDATPPRVDQFINDALREIYNTLGANAWFLRRIESVTVTASPGTAFTLPQIIKRLYRVEAPASPSQQLQWREVGTADQGRLQIVLNAPAGAYNFHHYVATRDLASDDDLCIVPPEYQELIVLLAVKRLAESAGNADFVSSLMAQAEPIWKTIKRDAARYEQQKKAAMEFGPNVGYWPQVSPIDLSTQTYGP